MIVRSRTSDAAQVLEVGRRKRTRSVRSECVAHGVIQGVRWAVGLSTVEQQLRCRPRHDERAERSVELGGRDQGRGGMGAEGWARPVCNGLPSGGTHKSGPGSKATVRVRVRVRTLDATARCRDTLLAAGPWLDASRDHVGRVRDKRGCRRCGEGRTASAAEKGERHRWDVGTADHRPRCGCGGDDRLKAVAIRAHVRDETGDTHCSSCSCYCCCCWCWCWCWRWRWRETRDGGARPVPSVKER